MRPGCRSHHPAGARARLAQQLPSAHGVRQASMPCRYWTSSGTPGTTPQSCLGGRLSSCCMGVTASMRAPPPRSRCACRAASHRQCGCLLAATVYDTGAGLCSCRDLLRFRAVPVVLDPGSRHHARGGADLPGKVAEARRRHSGHCRCALAPSSKLACTGIEACVGATPAGISSTTWSLSCPV